MYTLFSGKLQRRDRHMSCVEAFVTGIKINQAIKALFEGRSRDQGDLQTIKPMDQEHMAAI